MLYRVGIQIIFEEADTEMYISSAQFRKYSMNIHPVIGACH